MSILSRETKQTCGSRAGSVCESRTEAVQNILSWTHWWP